MVDNEQQFDDELLSAYLDDELAAEERARVEARLAADPAARQLLDELRAVSQATKQLPAATLDDDIRQTILRRAERAMLLSSAGEPASAGGGSAIARGIASRITIGRSPRGWLWAGLAAAAALMLTVYQSELVQNERIPGAVAARSEGSRESNGAPAARSELRALAEESTLATDESAPRAGVEIVPDAEAPSLGYEITPSPPAVSAPAIDRPAGGVAAGFAEGRHEAFAAAGDALARGESAAVASADNQPEPSAPAAATGRESAIDRSGGFGGAIAESTAADRPEAAFEPGDAEWLVVNLRCPTRAIEEKVFEDTLAKCNIAIEEPPTANEESLDRSVRWGEEAARGVRFRSEAEVTTERSRSDQRPADVVMVEAAPAQIKQCLDEIEADNENFRGISVDEPPAATEGVALNNLAAKKRAGVDWQQYNRGHVPQQQKLERSVDNYFYLQTERGQIVLGPADGDVTPAQTGTLAEPSSSGSERGRARRLRSWSEVEQLRQSAELSDLDDQGVAIDPPAAGRKLGLARGGASLLPKAKADMLQVLFLLHADDEATNSAATSSAQGLQKAD